MDYTYRHRTQDISVTRIERGFSDIEVLLRGSDAGPIQNLFQILLLGGGQPPFIHLGGELRNSNPEYKSIDLLAVYENEERIKGKLEVLRPEMATSNVPDEGKVSLLELPCANYLVRPSRKCIFQLNSTSLTLEPIVEPASKGGVIIERVPIELCLASLPSFERFYSRQLSQ